MEAVSQAHPNPAQAEFDKLKESVHGCTGASRRRAVDVSEDVYLSWSAAVMAAGPFRESL